MTQSLAIIVPAYNEEDAIPVFLTTMTPIFDQIRAKGLEPRLVFVNDGSRDDTVRVISDADWPVDVQLLKLSRNFGKESALTAGLASVDDDAVVVMDADLQDPPELIAEMIDHWRTGSKVVVPRRADRTEDSFSKRLTADWFYRLHNRISNVDVPHNAGDFRLMDRQVVEAVNKLPENRRFMKGILAWVGFETTYMEFKRPARSAGETKYSFWKMWRYAVEGITSFSDVPLIIWTFLGALISLMAFVYASYIVISTLIFGVETPGYASMITVVLFLGGIQVLGIGILGEYLGRVYSEVKRRPSFLIADDIRIPAKGKADDG